MSLDTQISDVISAIGSILKGKQNNLTSGVDIKTVNGTSLLGAGNISISGGSGTQNVYIQEEEPVLNAGENVMWIRKSANGDITINLVEGI